MTEREDHPQEKLNNEPRESIGDKIRREESRIWNEDVVIVDWEDEFFALVAKHYEEEGTHSLSADEEKKLVGWLSKYLQDRNEKITDHQQKYIFSKMALTTGRRNSEYKPKTQEYLINRDYQELHQRLLSEVFHMTAEEISDMEQGEPVLFRNDSEALYHIELSDESKQKLPKAFFEHPTKFIESLPNIDRAQHEFGESIESLNVSPYDFTRVKRYKDFVFKRVDFEKSKYSTEEIDESLRIKNMVAELKDARVEVQNFLGAVWDRGNVYLVSEYVPAESYYDLVSAYQADDRSMLRNSETYQLIRKLEKVLSDHHADFDNRNILVTLKKGKSLHHEKSLKKLTLIDFETNEPMVYRMR